jgi:hypothetical protein
MRLSVLDVRTCGDPKRLVAAVGSVISPAVQVGQKQPLSWPLVSVVAVVIGVV